MTRSLLDDAQLERIRGRAARYDRDNAFFAEDLDELKDAGYLRQCVPVALGGSGASLEHVLHEQIRLATAAPATALALNMHLLWTAVARMLAEWGDPSLDWVLREAADGQVFAFGVSEPGNDEVLSDSLTRAEPQPDGGYRFFGTKIFGSLSPAWTRLSVFGRDDSDPGAPVLVHGFIERDAAGYRILEDWNALGMRATQSHTTILEGAFVPAERVVRVLPVGPSADPFVFAIFAGFELLISAVYVGIGERALALAVESVRSRTSLRAGGAPLADDLDVRSALADAGIAQDGQYAQLTALARDVDSGVAAGAEWFPRLSGAKVRVTRTAREVVDRCVAVAGGASYRADSELSRLARDVLAGQFHPSSERAARRAMAASLLGPVTGRGA
ncbi:acyl-CoA dehydrogenase family protein [Planctomonas psychrotolerans]|uniref:acyl-CoA dehydrogenase family protein n=1 Tax=Planctomonas psychrotolerans TaxID=2528712 RepID=UPI00123A3851|nr:acyl-CoA dehydrogenase family protein [Planctomonas psychrotolerans]